MKIFESHDSRYMVKSALLITSVPLLMLGIILYSLWLLMAINHSYFRSAGLELVEPAQETFLLYVFKTQIDYLPYLGLFFIGVFFLGMMMAYMVLRPFNQVEEMCQEAIKGNFKDHKFQGLNNQKLIVRLGNFLCDYVRAKKAGNRISMPESLDKVKGPMMDWVFYFQFLCLMIFLTVITVTSINFFTLQLHEDTIGVALGFLQKQPKGLESFLTSQGEIIELIILVPSLISCVLYALIARLLITKVEGVTYAYVRDVRDVVNGQLSRRLRPRADDPGRNTADSINQLLEHLHPQPKAREVEEVDSLPHPSPI
jgi:hypothetical protein